MKKNYFVNSYFVYLGASNIKVMYICNYNHLLNIKAVEKNIR